MPLQEEPPLEVGVPDDGLPMEEQEPMPALPDGAPDAPFDSTPEVMEVDMDKPVAPSEAAPGDDPAGGQPIGNLPPAEGSSIAEESTLVPDPVPAGDTQPMTDRQSFFALDFRELDRGLTPEERQAWNSIYASFRGRSALSGKIIGADPHSMNVRSKETGRVERKTMYCVVVVLYRVPVYIPATEMWMGEARPDYVLQNMMGLTSTSSSPR